MMKVLAQCGLVLLLAFGSLGAASATDLEPLVAANFLLQSSGAQCSATLIHRVKRLVLTNYHCVENAISRNEREETQPDGTVKKITRVAYGSVDLFQHAYSTSAIVGRVELRAEILGADAKRDLALLRILSETTTLSAEVKLPPPGYKLKQGQEVYAVGNPLGLENTVSRGIINHLYREVRWEADRVAWFIQTDAVIAAGSSGGALYSTEGYLVGVPSAGYRGAALNFAIPFTIIAQFLETLPVWTAP